MFNMVFLATSLPATHCNTLQHTATHCNTLQHTVAHCNTLQHPATHTATQSLGLLQHYLVFRATSFTATHCNTLQHTATHCNTLQHTPQHIHRAAATSLGVSSANTTGEGLLFRTVHSKSKQNTPASQFVLRFQGLSLAPSPSLSRSVSLSPSLFPRLSLSSTCLAPPRPLSLLQRPARHNQKIWKRFISSKQEKCVSSLFG